MTESELLEGLEKENATYEYDAYVRDVAVLNIYFGEPGFQGESEFRIRNVLRLIVFFTTSMRGVKE